MLRDRFTWVEREGTQIHLVPVDDPIVAREGHVAVIADDYEATLARLAAGGFELREGSNAWNAPRMFVTDPAGHRIEVMSKPPHPPWPSRRGCARRAVRSGRGVSSFGKGRSQ